MGQLTHNIKPIPIIELKVEVSEPKIFSGGHSSKTQQKSLNLPPVESKSGYGTVNGRVYMSNSNVILSKCPTILSIKRVIMSNDPVVL